MIPIDTNSMIRQTELFVQKELEGVDHGHNWQHIERVRKIALTIAKNEPADLLIVEMAALLHEIGDTKFFEGSEDDGAKRVQGFLKTFSLAEKTETSIVSIVQNISFRKTLDLGLYTDNTIELRVVRDADRLDAMGAIGIARAFHYGGYKNRLIYDPFIPPATYKNAKAYQQSEAPTINHFYEKLLLLKDQMHTTIGRKMAEKRHEFMLEFLDQFYKEWSAEAD